MIPFSRADRVSGLIQEVLSELLNKRIRDPRLAMATITSVKMSRDLKLARIYFTIYGDSEKSRDIFTLVMVVIARRGSRIFFFNNSDRTSCIKPLTLSAREKGIISELFPFPNQQSQPGPNLQPY